MQKLCIEYHKTISSTLTTPNWNLNGGLWGNYPVLVNKFQCHQVAGSTVSLHTDHRTPLHFHSVAAYVAFHLGPQVVSVVFRFCGPV
jgi:hypothetical protein